MTKNIHGIIAVAVVAAAMLALPGELAAKPKCSAPGVDDWEGTDQEGITKQCKAIFEACVDTSLACDLRKKKCAQYDKMDRDGSCYKRKR